MSVPFIPAYEGQFPSLGPLLIPHIENHLGIVLMREQAVRLVHLYRLDLRGNRVYRRAALRRPKGAGKSPEGAYTAFGELTGPVVFDGWGEDGQPIGRPHHAPWVQLAAVSEDQTANVSVWLYDTLASQPQTLRDFGIDLGRTRIYLKGRPGRIETVTAAAGSREGQPITYAVLDQTEEWKRSNGGKRLARVLWRNVGKNDGWSYELQNAPGLEDDSVAAATQHVWESGHLGIFFDTREPTDPPDLDAVRQRLEEGAPEPGDRQAIMTALADAYRESAERGFVSLDRLANDCLDPSTLVSENYRFFFNIPWSDEARWADARTWDRLKRDIEPEPQEEIAAGFVGLAYQGAALIGCRIATGELWTVGVWETDGRDMVSRIEVTTAVEAMMDRFLVRRFYVNPQEWATEYDAWHLAYGDMVISRPPQQVAKMAYAVDRFRSAMGAGDVRHDGNAVLRRHILAAFTKKISAGTLIVARTDDTAADQITAAKAAVLAWEARADVLATAEQEPEPWFAFD
jgi:hypothetical protein